MAAMGVFIGCGPPIRGREANGLEVFNEEVEYWARLQQEGQIESFEVVLHSPHGGDLSGFALLRDSGESLDRIPAQRRVQSPRRPCRPDRRGSRRGLGPRWGDRLAPQVEGYTEALGGPPEFWWAPGALPQRPGAMSDLRTCSSGG
jgi:hypothetical protein